jgi:hypothetical protein
MHPRLVRHLLSKPPQQACIQIRSADVIPIMMESTGSSKPLPAPLAPDLATAIHELIERRVGQAISDLTVASEMNRILVRGRTHSFYDWQRVQAVCRQALSGYPEFHLDCKMSVSYVTAVDN